MKNFSFDGRLGKDAELLQTKAGKPYIRFTVANNSFSGGTESTDWIDVTSYDQYVVENRMKYLTKGTYVIVNGDVRFDVSIKDGKVWKNIYVNANAIDTPYFGKKDEDGTQVQGQTQIQAQVQPTVTTYAQAPAQPTVMPQVQVSQPQYQAPVQEPSVTTYNQAPQAQPAYQQPVAQPKYQPHVAAPTQPLSYDAAGGTGEDLPF